MSSSDGTSMTPFTSDNSSSLVQSEVDAGTDVEPSADVERNISIEAPPPAPPPDDAGNTDVEDDIDERSIEAPPPDDGAGHTDVEDNVDARNTESNIEATPYVVPPNEVLADTDVEDDDDDAAAKPVPPPKRARFNQKKSSLHKPKAGRSLHEQSAKSTPKARLSKARATKSRATAVAPASTARPSKTIKKKSASKTKSSPSTVLKEKKVKDPMAPKKANSAYMLFSQHARKQADYKGLNLIDSAKR